MGQWDLMLQCSHPILCEDFSELLWRFTKKVDSFYGFKMSLKGDAVLPAGETLGWDSWNDLLESTDVVYAYVFISISWLTS